MKNKELTPFHIEHRHKFERITTKEHILRKPSVAVELGDEKEIERCRVLAMEMEDILYFDKSKGLKRDNIIGYGLSARQLVSLETQESPRLSVVVIPEAEDKYRAQSNKQVINGLELWMLNPSIIRCNKVWRYRQEGCLSFPGVFYNTMRYLVATVGFVDLKTLAPREIEFYGMEAVVMQHEVEHHDGRLFIDHKLTPLQAPPKVGPNEPCPCGSGKKYKKCHQGEDL